LLLLLLHLLECWRCMLQHQVLLLWVQVVCLLLGSCIAAVAGVPIATGIH
jgi:hypothetical protein